MIFEEKTLKSERIYEGTILNLRRDEVTVLHGTSYREIVEHNGGAVLAALTDEGKMVMVRQFRKSDGILSVCRICRRGFIPLPLYRLDDRRDQLR